MNENSNTCFNALQQKIVNYRVEIDNAILSELNKRKNSIFHRPLVKALEGGKRLRPILLLLAFENIHKQKTDPFPAAVAVEFVHTESLIHDDIIDRDYLRRETEAFHTSYGREMALLSADFILSMILDIATRYQDPKIPQVLALATSEMCEGELEELEAFNNKQKLNKNQYVNIVSKKTASLFEASAAIGAIIAGAGEDEVQALSDYGRFLGISYQIQDDITDLKNATGVNIQRLLDLDSEEAMSLGEISDSHVLRARERLEKLQMNEARTLLAELAESTKSGEINHI
jgi:octaprenyl-diphosphate synthase